MEDDKAQQGAVCDGLRSSGDWPLGNARSPYIKLLSRTGVGDGEAETVGPDSAGVGSEVGGWCLRRGASGLFVDGGAQECDFENGLEGRVKWRKLSLQGDCHGPLPWCCSPGCDAVGPEGNDPMGLLGSRWGGVGAGRWRSLERAWEVDAFNVVEPLTREHINEVFAEAPVGSSDENESADGGELEEEKEGCVEKGFLRAVKGGLSIAMDGWGGEGVQGLSNGSSSGTADSDGGCVIEVLSRMSSPTGSRSDNTPTRMSPADLDFLSWESSPTRGVVSYSPMFCSDDDDDYPVVGSWRNFRAAGNVRAKLHPPETTRDDPEKKEGGAGWKGDAEPWCRTLCNTGTDPPEGQSGRVDPPTLGGPSLGPPSLLLESAHRPSSCTLNELYSLQSRSSDQSMKDALDRHQGASSNTGLQSLGGSENSSETDAELKGGGVAFKGSYKSQDMPQRNEQNRDGFCAGEGDGFCAGEGDGRASSASPLDDPEQRSEAVCAVFDFLREMGRSMVRGIGSMQSKAAEIQARSLSACDGVGCQSLPSYTSSQYRASNCKGYSVNPHMDAASRPLAFANRGTASTLPEDGQEALHDVYQQHGTGYAPFPRVSALMDGTCMGAESLRKSRSHRRTYSSFPSGVTMCLPPEHQDHKRLPTNPEAGGFLSKVDEQVIKALGGSIAGLQQDGDWIDSSDDFVIQALGGCAEVAADSQAVQGINAASAQHRGSGSFPMQRCRSLGSPVESCWESEKHFLGRIPGAGRSYHKATESLDKTGTLERPLLAVRLDSEPRCLPADHRPPSQAKSVSRSVVTSEGSSSLETGVETCSFSSPVASNRWKTGQDWDQSRVEVANPVGVIGKILSEVSKSLEERESTKSRSSTPESAPTMSIGATAWPTKPVSQSMAVLATADRHQAISTTWEDSAEIDDGRDLCADSMQPLLEGGELVRPEGVNKAGASSGPDAAGGETHWISGGICQGQENDDLQEQGGQSCLEVAVEEADVDSAGGGRTGECETVGEVSSDAGGGLTRDACTDLDMSEMPCPGALESQIYVPECLATANSIQKVQLVDGSASARSNLPVGGEGSLGQPSTEPCPIAPNSKPQDVYIQGVGAMQPDLKPEGDDAQMASPEDPSVSEGFGGAVPSVGLMMAAEHSAGGVRSLASDTPLSMQLSDSLLSSDCTSGWVCDKPSGVLSYAEDHNVDSLQDSDQENCCSDGDPCMVAWKADGDRGSAKESPEDLMEFLPTSMPMEWATNGFSPSIRGPGVFLDDSCTMAWSQTVGAQCDFVVSQEAYTGGIVEYVVEVEHLEGWAFVGAIADGDPQADPRSSLAESPLSFGWSNECELYSGENYYFECAQEMIKTGTVFHLELDMIRQQLCIQFPEPSRGREHGHHGRYFMCELSSLPAKTWRIVFEWLGSARVRLGRVESFDAC